MKNEKRDEHESTRSPLSKAMGDHPVSTGIGAVAGGMAAGAAAGTVAGPLGTIAGATAGAILGGVAGKAAGRVIDPTVEDEHWKKSFTKESYYQPGLTFEDYSPAYRTGYQAHTQYVGRKFHEIERDLETSYNRTKGASKLTWEKAKHATRAAWERAECAITGNSKTGCE